MTSHRGEIWQKVGQKHNLAVCTTVEERSGHVLGMCIASVASLQKMADHGREAPGEKEIFSRYLRATQIQ